MKSVNTYLSYLLILTSCSLFQSCKTPSQYFGRRDVAPTIANGDGTGYRDGELVNTTNMICTYPDEYEYLMDYFSDKEFRLMKCLKYGKRHCK